MLDAVATPAFSTTAEILGGVRVVYCAEEAQARLLGDAEAAEWVAIDIETAPNKTAAKRLAGSRQGEGELAAR